MLKLFSLFAGLALAAGVSSPMHEKLMEACAKDLAERCSKMTGIQAVACLDKNKGNNECTAPFAKACPGVKAGVALYKCLKEHDAELPPACRVTRKAPR